MADFEDKVRAKLEQLEHAREPGVSIEHLDRVLARLADALSKHPAIGATVRRSSTSALRQLVLWPKLRRHEAISVLDFAPDGVGLRRVSGHDGGPRAIRTAQELETYFTDDFLESQDFLMTLAAFEQRCEEDVSGFLRKGNTAWEPTSEDVLVVVSPQEQRKLAEARPGELVQVLAKEDRIPTTGEYARERNSKAQGDAYYHTFVAGGYGMHVFFHSTTEDGLLRISGQVMSEQELDSSAAHPA